MNKSKAILTATALLALTACADPGGYQSRDSYPGYGRSDYPDYSRSNYSDYSRSDYPDYDRSGYSRSDYGVVESISVEEPRSGIGIGAVAGGVVGGLLGNQFGKGKGNTAATIAGAAGGAYAGHQIEKNQRSNRPVYRLTVRMQDGSYQTVTQDADTALRVGDRVRVVEGKAYPL